MVRACFLLNLGRKLHEKNRSDVRHSLTVVEKRIENAIRSQYISKRLFSRKRNDQRKKRGKRKISGCYSVVRKMKVCEVSPYPTSDSPKKLDEENVRLTSASICASQGHECDSRSWAEKIDIFQYIFQECWGVYFVCSFVLQREVESACTVLPKLSS